MTEAEKVALINDYKAFAGKLDERKAFQDAELKRMAEENPDLLNEGPSSHTPAVNVPAWIEQQRAAYAQQTEKEIADQEAMTKRQGDLVRKQQQERKPYLDQANKTAEEIAQLKPPTLERPPTPPNTQEMLRPTSLQKTMGMASIFALLAVGVAKGSGSLALNAFSGFLEGAHAGNVEQATAALKDFNSNMARVREANEAALAEYNAIIGNKKLSLDAQERAFRMKALEFQDELSLAALEQGGMNAVHARRQDLARMSTTWGIEAFKYQQLEEQMRHAREMEKAAMLRAQRADKAAAGEITQAQIAKIQDQARQEISAALPRDQLGQIILGPEWGKTIQERTAKFTKLVDSRAEQIAARRGLPGLFGKDPELAGNEDPALALQHAISSGEVPKDTGAAMQFLQKRGVPPAKAAAIVQGLANGTSEY